MHDPDWLNLNIQSIELGGEKLMYILLLKSCRIEAKSPVKVLWIGSAPDLQRIAGTEAGWWFADDSHNIKSIIQEIAS